MHLSDMFDCLFHHADERFQWEKLWVFEDSGAVLSFGRALEVLSLLLGAFR